MTIAIAATLLTVIAGWAVRHALLTGRRLTYGVLLDTSVDADMVSPPRSHRPAAAELPGSTSMVILQVRNSGLFPITAQDYERPLSFHFGDRVVLVLGARDEAATPHLEVHLANHGRTLEVGAVGLRRNRGFDLFLLLLGDGERRVGHAGVLRRGRITSKAID
ncbi:hypothetical protein [Saccharothrix lopnurensis]|uniref:Uncharacterized protein n=1 Tax=Saccharothrix lopnurensis TaxID=1670621 RepID=A0ABW1P9T3_9PSEU